MVTAKTKEVGALIAAGLTSEEIAAQLGISLKTVAYHRGRLYALLGLAGKANANVLLTHYALEHGWTQNIYRGPGRPKKAR